MTYFDCKHLTHSLCYSVGLKVTSLKWTGPASVDDSQDMQPEIPTQIEYKDMVPRDADIGLGNEETSQSRQGKSVHIPSITILLTPSAQAVHRSWMMIFRQKQQHKN